MALGEKSESFEAELIECSSQLSLATQLINILLRWVGLSCDCQVILPHFLMMSCASASLSHDIMCPQTLGSDEGQGLCNS